MLLRLLEIRNFRNHAETSLECADGINVFAGDNGEGKTNLVEAISYLCLTRSFYATSDGVVLRQGEEEFRVNGVFVGDGGTERRVEARYERATGHKTITINKAPVETLSSIIGEFPVVVLSPEQNGITFGAPTERRKFLDMVIAQASRLYLSELLEYRRILRQRNKILLDAKLTRRDYSDTIEPWDQSLIETGSGLVQKRWMFVKNFLPVVSDAYRSIAGGMEIPDMEYQPSFPCHAGEDLDGLRRSFAEELRGREDEERSTGSTAVGPHRDELNLLVDGKSIRKFASQGQHKTYLVALKLAEFRYLREYRGENPLLLLDDVFSELDRRRAARLVTEVEQAGQVFITATDQRPFPSEFRWKGKNRVYEISGGAVRTPRDKERSHAVSGNGDL